MTVLDADIEVEPVAQLDEVPHCVDDTDTEIDAVGGALTEPRTVGESESVADVHVDSVGVGVAEDEADAEPVPTRGVELVEPVLQATDDTEVEYVGESVGRSEDDAL